MSYGETVHPEYAFVLPAGISLKAFTIRFTDPRAVFFDSASRTPEHPSKPKPRVTPWPTRSQSISRVRVPAAANDNAIATAKLVLPSPHQALVIIKPLRWS